MMHVSSIARRYGRSLARVAIQHKLEKTVGTELQGLAEYFRDNAVPRLTLESPATTNERRQKLLAAIESAAQLSTYTRNALRAMVEHKRFHLFAEVVEAYRREVDRFHDVVEVEVVSAEPLDEKQREALKGTLQRTLGGGKDVRLHLAEDKALLAGMVARVGSVVYDGSLRRQLAVIREQLVSE